MNKILIILFFSMGCFLDAAAQSLSVSDYIQRYKDLAIREMKRMGVPASITLAQGLLETQNGNSDLLRSSNNHFGIKCKSTWTAETVSHDDDAPGECFRKYKSAEDSYRDHSNFLRGNSRYDFLFKLNPADYKAWAKGLRQAGYATNPRYPEILIKYIEDNNLQQYTLQAIDEVPTFEASNYKDDPETKQTISFAKEEEITAPVKLTINGSKVLLVPKGTSLLAIATENHINLSKLLAINDLTRDGILDKEQYIFLEKKQKEGSKPFCIAEPNESLYDIAQRNGVILQNLYSYNHDLTPDDYVVAGSKIFLQPPVIQLNADPHYVAARGATMQFYSSYPANNTPAGSKTALHQVQAKESLYAISKKYGLTVEQLKALNHLSDDHIEIGQQLIISK